MLVTPSGILIDVSELQPLKVPYSMLVMPEGILIDVSPLHPSNAEEPMLVTLSGITMDVTSLQRLNASFSIDTTEYFILFHVILAGMIRLLFVNSVYPLTLHVRYVLD